MLVKNEINLERAIAQEKKERAKQEARAWAANVYLNGKVLLDPDEDPTKLETRLGQKLTTEAFEAKLKKLNSNFIFERIELPDGTFHKTCKRLCLALPYGKEVVCVYSIGAIPEFSVHKIREEIVVDDDLAFVNRKDLPSHRPGNLEVETDPNSPEYMNMRGDAYKFDGPLPGIKKVKVPGGELIRGWRTVLARIVGEGFASPAQVENVFGSANSLAWATKMGKRKEIN